MTNSSLILALVVVLLVVAVAATWPGGGSGTDGAGPVVSRVDGRTYRVHGGSVRAADLMAQLNARIDVLIRRLRAKYGGVDSARGRAVGRLVARYDIRALVENSPHNVSDDTSYTIDKGRVLALCLRERTEAARLHSFNVLTFVSIHELAHIASREYGHHRTFWATFKFFLEEAVAAGVFDAVDYRRHPRRYCGSTINYSPLFDEGLPALL